MWPVSEYFENKFIICIHVFGNDGVHKLRNELKTMILSKITEDLKASTFYLNCIIYRRERL